MAILPRLKSSFRLPDYSGPIWAVINLIKVVNQLLRNKEEKKQQLDLNPTTSKLKKKEATIVLEPMTFRPNVKQIGLEPVTFRPNGKRI
nr:hypothetical protein [Tanacetum cinerariifolium]